MEKQYETIAILLLVANAIFMIFNKISNFFKDQKLHNEKMMREFIRTEMETYKTNPSLSLNMQKPPMSVFDSMENYHEQLHNETPYKTPYNQCRDRLNKRYNERSAGHDRLRGANRFTTERPMDESVASPKKIEENKSN